MPKAMSVSEKTAIIEALFDERYRNGTIPQRKRLITLKQVSAAIRKARSAGTSTLSDRNPANFMKDIVRKETRNEVFPGSVVERGWTAQQATGKGNCFRFIPLPPDQATAFKVIVPPARVLREPHPIQSLSLAYEVRRYGRRDESWLTQVVTDLGLVQTHFALHHGDDVAGLALLASHIKLGRGEVDALYYGVDHADDRYLLACEMKGRNEVMDEDQILNVAETLAAAPATRNASAAVIPVGVKVIYPKSVGGMTGLIWVKVYDRDFPPLQPQSEGVYRLVPPVPGID